jgi:hypothetical protein
MMQNPGHDFIRTIISCPDQFWFATVAMKAMMEGVVARTGFTFKPSDEDVGTNLVYCGIRIDMLA